MADIKKYLDQAGVSTLWAQVAAEITSKVNVEKTRAMEAESDLLGKITAETARADAAEKANATAAQNAQSKANDAFAKAQANETAIGVLNGAATVEGSVAYKIAQIVTADGGSIDKLEEIAAWIAEHPSDAAEYNERITTNAADIDKLEALVGSKAVATQISDAIAAQDLSKYALASSLTSLQQTYNTFVAKGVRPITQDEIDKLAKLNLENGNLSISGSVAAGSVTGLQTYVDGRIDALVVPMTADEVIGACKIEA
jgi:uncharacterized membrane protein YfhO